MCEKCFEKEVERFNSEKHFKQFELELKQKLKQTDGLFFFRQSSESELVRHTIYSCRNCDEKWYFQIPDTLGSGFFLNNKSGPALFEKAKSIDDGQVYRINDHYYHLLDGVVQHALNNIDVRSQ